ncbi:MAG: TatD family hydrolase [Rhodoferax sp.]|nr:TatD family hydrolase [Rhodoferax sp.]
MQWIDTHCHLDAPEFGDSAQLERGLAATNHVAICVFPAVEVANFEAVRALAHADGDAYCLGIHPLYVGQAHDNDLNQLDAALSRCQGDPRLVAVGEIGLDFFVPELQINPLRERQIHFFRAQLKLANKYQLPVVLHSRRAVDQVLKHLRELGRPESDTRAQAGAGKCLDITRWRGIAHAFNGSTQQARAFTDLGLKLGFGGALTFERALQLRRLAAELPLDAIVLETDSPDMPPHWLYTTAEQRAAGHPQSVNSPAQLPRIAAELAGLRGITEQALSRATTRNAQVALPKLVDLLPRDV